MENIPKINDEHWRDNLIGLTLNKRIEKAIISRHSLESQLERLELQRGLLQRKIRGGRVELFPNIFEGVMCAVTDKKRKILDIGFNTPEDLILDNFGKWLAAFVTPPAQAAISVILTDVANSSQTFKTISASSGYFNTYDIVQIGTRLQVGSGSTAAARANYAIQTAFGTSPESGRFATGVGSYAAGYVSLSGAISAGGSGTVNETGFFGVWANTANAQKEIMLFHDILGAGVGFVAGNSIIVSYSIAL